MSTPDHGHTASATRAQTGVHAEAHALTLFRVLPSGEGRAYTATTFPKDPFGGCEHFIRMCRAVGWIKPPLEAGYGVLDVLNENGDVVRDFTVTTSAAFQQIKRRLHLSVESDGE